MMGCVSEEIEGYENKLELELFKEYRDVIGLFKFVVETERRFYLCNHVDVQARPFGGDVFFELTLTDAWVWTSTARRASCVRCGSSPIRT